MPVSEPLLDRHLRKQDLDTWTFGPGGDVHLLSFDRGLAEIEARMQTVELELPYSEPHNLLNTLAAVAAARALGIEVGGRVDVRFSSLRGEVVELPGGVTVVNDCYNANPMSMRAALDHLASSEAERRIAVLGTMAELGPGSEGFHREIGAHAAAWESTCSWRWARRRSTTPAASTARPTRLRAPRRRARCWRSSRAPATAC